MRSTVIRLSVALAGGAVGALANSLAVWMFGAAGVTAALGASIAPALTPGWLYPRLVWGALWGLLFLLPLWKGSVWKRGFVLSLGPTLAQLLYFFPRGGHAPFGTDLGATVPLFVLLFNAIWGWVAAAWAKKGGV